MEGLEVYRTNLETAQEKQSLILLLNAYICDEMGGGEIIDQNKARQIMAGLKAMPTARIYLARNGDNYIGLAVCFVSYSTFLAQKIINIHDLIVLKSERRKGVARALLAGIEADARNENFAKITLEVRSDNIKAKSLYRASGIQPLANPMEFWVKMLCLV